MNTCQYRCWSAMLGRPAAPNPIWLAPPRSSSRMPSLMVLEVTPVSLSPSVTPGGGPASGADGPAIGVVAVVPPADGADGVDESPSRGSVSVVSSTVAAPPASGSGSAPTALVTVDG